MDFENAAIKSTREVWPETKIQLCRVHCIRSWRKKIVEIFGQNFLEQNPSMRLLWTAFRGIFFIPPTVFPMFLEFIETEFRPKLPKTKFDTLLKYLSSNYFSTHAKYQPQFWSCYTDISDFDDCTNSTNSIESLNRVLKDLCPQGKITFRKCFETIHRFKCESLNKYNDAMFNDGMNSQGRETLRKKEATLDIMYQFSNQADLNNPKVLFNYCLKFAMYNIDAYEYDIIVQLC